MRKEEEDTAKEELLEDKENIVDGKAEEKPEEDTVKEAEKNRAEGEEAKTPDGGSDNKTETVGTADDTGIKPDVTNESGAGDDKVQ